MSTEATIFLEVQRKGGQKAAQIARTLGLERQAVNQALYGPLASQVEQDKHYGWWVRGQMPTNGTAIAPAQAPESTPLARLARYYLECLSQEPEGGSVRLRRAGTAPWIMQK